MHGNLLRARFEKPVPARLRLRFVLANWHKLRCIRSRVAPNADRADHRMRRGTGQGLAEAHIIASYRDLANRWSGDGSIRHLALDVTRFSDFVALKQEIGATPIERQEEEQGTECTRLLVVRRHRLNAGWPPHYTSPSALSQRTEVRNASSV